MRILRIELIRVINALLTRGLLFLLRKHKADSECYPEHHEDVHTRSRDLLDEVENESPQKQPVFVEAHDVAGGKETDEVKCDRYQHEQCRHDFEPIPGCVEIHLIPHPLRLRYLRSDSLRSAVCRT